MQTKITSPEQGVFEQYRQIFKNFPNANQDQEKQFQEHDRTLTKPLGSLGQLEELCRWYARWSKRYPMKINHPRVAIFAGNHGVARQNVSAYPASVTMQMVENFKNGGAAINQICKILDSDLRVYELALQHPTRDFTEATAMDEKECADAISYGMTAVENHIDVICIGEMGIANTTSAATLAYGLLGGKASDWTGVGTGIDKKTLQHKTDIVEQAVKLHKKPDMDSFDWLAAVGGREIAAMVGACIAARIAHIPVILDGYTSSVAGAILYKINKSAIDHCIIAHQSSEAGHRHLLKKIGKKPLLQLDLRLGEASGAAIALNILKIAIKCHHSMASFAEAGVDQKI
ncbi:MAG: nicotinate-nucleotide--dimethylbenzimidazole phosphoribosyltransferase [Pseudomonadota bacterium]